MSHDPQEAIFTICEEESNRRLDQVLATRWPKYSRAFFQKCITDHRVLVNRVSSRPAYKVIEGMTVSLIWPEQKAETLSGENIPLDILYEDGDIIVINKPIGLVIHPANGNKTGTLVQALLYYKPEVFGNMIDEDQRPGIVHRLDKNTSGVLIIAKNKHSWEILKKTFKTHNLKKIYRGIVKGTPELSTGKIETDISRHPVNRLKRAVVPFGTGKTALTKYRIVDSNCHASLLDIQIFTGRTHQIRVHCSYMKHPILGDSLYGGAAGKEDFPAKRQLLHAWKLIIPHPITKEVMTFTAPLPEDMAEAAEFYGLNWHNLGDSNDE
ncbi:MAG: RluA family pseudouridine synthase [Lentisphaeria bacterium]